MVCDCATSNLVMGSVAAKRQIIVLGFAHTVWPYFLKRDPYQYLSCFRRYVYWYSNLYISAPSGGCLPPLKETVCLQGLAKNRLCTFLVAEDVHDRNLLTISTLTPVECTIHRYFSRGGSPF